MLTESLNYSNFTYIHCPFPNWESLYNCIVENNLLNVPISILFHYNKSVLNEIVVAVNPVNNNSPVGLLLEGYNMNNTVLEDSNNDGYEDKNAFHFLSDSQHKKLMELLEQHDLLNKNVNILYKINNNYNNVIKICYSDSSSTHTDSSLQKCTLYTYQHNIREIAYIVSSNEHVAEIDTLISMNPVNIFIKKLS